MNIISLDLEKLNSLDFNSNIISTEGGLYIFDYNGSKMVAKELDFVGTPYYNNKLKIVLSLNNYKDMLPEEFCVPEGLIENNGLINGFYLPFINGNNLNSILSSKDISHDVKIKYLKLVGNLLEKIKNVNVFLNDLHEANFMIDEKDNLKVVDLDSSVIGNTHAFASKYLTPFSLAAHINKYEVVNDNNSFGYIHPSHDTDLYCYVIMILNYLIGKKVSSYNIQSFNKLLNDLNDVGIDKELINIFSLIISDKKNINPVNHLDTITDEQFYNTQRLRKSL